MTEGKDKVLKEINSITGCTEEEAESVYELF